MQEEIVTLASIGHGSALELFGHELKKVLANVMDPNTDPTATRKIVIETIIKPDKGREIAFATVKVTSKLAGIKPVEQTIYIGKIGDVPTATAKQTNQSSMFDEKQTTETKPTEPAAPLRAVEKGASA